MKREQLNYLWETRVTFFTSAQNYDSFDLKRFYSQEI